MNTASGGDGISIELFQILKHDAVKVLHSMCQQIWKTQQWPQDWKMSVFKHHLRGPPDWYTNPFTRNLKINDTNELTRKRERGLKKELTVTRGKDREKG